MKVFYITQASIPSTAAQSVYDMCVSEVFARRGYEVHLIIKNKFWNRRPKGFNGNLWDFYGVNKTFNIVKVFGLPRCTSWFQHCAFSYVEKEESLVFTQSATTAVKAVDRGFNVILDRHGLLPTEQEQAVRDRIERPNFLGVAAVTKTLRDDYIKKIPALKDKIFAWPNGVRHEKYLKAAKEAQSQKAESDNFVVGYVGSFHRGKGLEVILPLAELCPDVTFKIYGGTKNAEAVKNKYGVAKLASNIELNGPVPQSQVPKAIATFDVALLPNQEHVIMAHNDDIGNWTCPMKMLEYMASGRAIISSDLPVLREVLENGRNALLVPPTDYNAWRNKIMLLRSDRDLRKRLGNTAQKDTLEKYSWESRIDKIFTELNIEKKVMKSR